MKQIRGHHLFCMTLFSGHGYSESFARNMEATIASLARDPEQQLRLLTGQDEICAACPNLRKDGGCEYGTLDVQHRDRAVFDVLGISADCECSWKQLVEKLRRVSEPEFLSVCANCRWLESGICSYPAFSEKLQEKTD